MRIKGARTVTVVMALLLSVAGATAASATVYSTGYYYPYKTVYLGNCPIGLSHVNDEDAGNGRGYAKELVKCSGEVRSRVEYYDLADGSIRFKSGGWYSSVATVSVGGGGARQLVMFHTGYYRK